MQYHKKIVESNINKAIEYFQCINNDYISIFDNVKENLIEKEYHSITSNYVALFLHHMIKNDVDINTFNNVISHIYEMDESIEHAFHRFFGGSCCDISLENYMQLQQPNIPEEEKNYSIWNEMSYYFYDIKNNSIGLNKDRIKYLESICEFIPEKRINELYSSGFVMFLVIVINNPDDLSPILKKIQSNPSFAENKSFIHYFLRGLSNQSYNMDEDKKLEVFNSLNKSLDNFEEIFLNKFLTYFPKDKYKKFDFDLGMSNFLNIVGQDKVFNQIDKVYKNILDKEKKENSYKKNSYDIELEVSSELSSSLEVSFGKKSFQVNYEIIDIKKSFIENFVYIKLLEIQIVAGKEPKIDKNRRDYILKEFSIDDSGPYAELHYVKKDEIKKYFEYISIKEELPEKTVSKSKLKV